MLATPLPTRAATPLSAQDPAGWCSRRASWCGAGLLGVTVLLEAGGDRSVFSLQSNCWDWRPRDDDKQADTAICQHRNQTVPFQVHPSLGVCFHQPLGCAAAPNFLQILP